MRQELTKAIEILEHLVAFETVSAGSNRDFVAYVAAYLHKAGIDGHLSFDESGERANIHGFVGPSLDGGVVLNGHTDVVPVEGQKWFSDPFVLRQHEGRLYGRGAVDMKGFLASMLAAIPNWQQKPLQRPIHISMCFDEEIGGFGAPILVNDIASKGPKPAIAIVGEPTMMGIVTGHKGGLELRTEITGLSAHSCDPRKGASAIIFATRLINHLEQVAAELASAPDRQSPYDPPYCTINIGTIAGGSARNAVAGDCGFDWEIRPLPGDDADALFAKIMDHVDETLLPQMRRQWEGAEINTEVQAKVPALDEKLSGDAAALLSAITGTNATGVVAFGTDAGHFCNAGISTAVFGPGSIERAHKPDEYIKISEIVDCLKFFDRLGDRLSR